MAEEEVLTQKTLGGLEVQAVTETDDYINMLLYGNPGSGKTVLAGSADAVPELRSVLFIDVEGGTMSLRDRFPDIEVVRVTSWNDMQLIYNELYEMKHDYKTVVLDSVTEMQKFSMYNIMRELIKEHPDRDPEVPSVREWGKNIEQIRRLVRGFRDLPMHTIITALAATDKDAKTGKMMTRPSLSGKLAMEIGGFVDIVLYLYTTVADDDIMRLALSAGTDKEIAKDRSDSLPVILQNPDMTKIYEHIFSTGETDES